MYKAFTPEALRTFLPQKVEVIEECLIDFLDKMRDKEIDAAHLMETVALTILVRTIFGRSTSPKGTDSSVDNPI